MNISLVDVAEMNFRTDDQSDKLNSDFMSRLGVRTRYLPARLAIARSLSLGVEVPLSEDDTEFGKAIKGHTLFGKGADLSIWLALIVERAEEVDIDKKRLISIVGAHWRRGLAKLDEEWTSVRSDVPRFIERLADIADLSVHGLSSPVSPDFDVPAGALATTDIRVPLGEIGEDVSTGDRVFWNLNGKGGSPHAAIMGGSGSGKTVTAAAMLRTIREQSAVPLLAFDFKGELAGFTGTGERLALGEAYEAQVIEPPRMPIPLDVLALSMNDQFGIDEAAQRFRDSLSRLKGSKLGSVQRNSVHEAASRALSTAHPCDLSDIRDRLGEVYTEHGFADDGAITCMADLCRFPLFEAKYTPAEFFQKSWIVKLPPNVTEDSRTIVVNLLLDALDQYLNGLADAETNSEGARHLRIICMIDEAHQILGTRMPSLSRLIRMSRSKGGAVMLVSQSPDDFSGEEDEFLDNMGLVAAFATNAKPGAARRVLGEGANLTRLQTGQCFARIDKVTRKVRAW